MSPLRYGGARGGEGQHPAADGGLDFGVGVGLPFEAEEGHLVQDCGRTRRHIAPVKRCAKSLLLTLLGVLVRRPLPVANITAAALFRTIEQFTPSLLIDEADTFVRDSDELRGILNAGHFRPMAFVVRTIGDHHEPRQFSTWCPKAIALIGRLPDTLEDRSIVVPLRRRAKTERVARPRLDRLHAEGGPLRRQAARWAADHLDALRAADPDTLEELNDRQNDNWRSLLAIADQAGGDWPARAREAARVLSKAQGEDQAAGVLLLQDLRVLFKQTGVDRLATTEILDRLTKLEERPWGEWRRGKPITSRGLAKLLEPFEIRPKTIRLGDETPKGYMAEDCEDAFSRYLPSYPPHPQQVKNDEELDRESYPPQGPDVADRKSDVSARNERHVADVADRTPLGEPEWLNE